MLKGYDKQRAYRNRKQRNEPIYPIGPETRAINGKIGVRYSKRTDARYGIKDARRIWVGYSHGLTILRDLSPSLWHLVHVEVRERNGRRPIVDRVISLQRD